MPVLKAAAAAVVGLAFSGRVCFTWSTGRTGSSRTLGERGASTARGDTCMELADDVERGDTDERMDETEERVETAEGGDRNTAILMGSPAASLG